MDGDNVERGLREFTRHGVVYKVFDGVALNLHGLSSSIEEADAAREEWARRNFERYQVRVRESRR